MLRSRSTAVQSERTRRRSPGARQLDRPPKNSNFSVNVVLRASGCEMIAKVRRGALSSVRVLINPLQLCDEAARPEGGSAALPAGGSLMSLGGLANA